MLLGNPTAWWLKNRKFLSKTPKYSEDEYDRRDDLHLNEDHGNKGMEHEF